MLYCRDGVRKYNFNEKTKAIMPQRYGFTKRMYSEGTSSIMLIEDKEKHTESILSKTDHVQIAVQPNSYTAFLIEDINGDRTIVKTDEAHISSKTGKSKWFDDTERNPYDFITYEDIFNIDRVNGIARKR